MGFRAYNSKGVDKNGAKCNMWFGRITKIYLPPPEKLVEEGQQKVTPTRNLESAQKKKSVLPQTPQHTHTHTHTHTPRARCTRAAHRLTTNQGDMRMNVTNEMIEMNEMSGGNQVE